MTAPSTPAERAAMFYTPGPWSVTWERDSHFTERQHLNFPDGSGVPLGLLSDADAGLIAAAPELYEALRNIVGMIVNCPGVPSNSDSLPMMVLANARGALAKAEGRRR